MKSSCDFSTILGAKQIVKNIKHFIPNFPYFLLSRSRVCQGAFPPEAFLPHTGLMTASPLCPCGPQNLSFILFMFFKFFSSGNNLFMCWSSLERLYIC